MTITVNLYNATVWKVLFLCKYLIIQLDLYTAIDYHQSYGGALFNVLVKDIKPYSLLNCPKIADKVQLTL